MARELAAIVDILPLPVLPAGAVQEGRGGGTQGSSQPPFPGSSLPAPASPFQLPPIHPGLDHPLVPDISP